MFYDWRTENYPHSSEHVSLLIEICKQLWIIMHISQRSDFKSTVTIMWKCMMIFDIIWRDVDVSELCGFISLRSEQNYVSANKLTGTRTHFIGPVCVIRRLNLCTLCTDQRGRNGKLPLVSCSLAYIINMLQYFSGGHKLLRKLKATDLAMETRLPKLLKLY